MDGTPRGASVYVSNPVAAAPPELKWMLINSAFLH
jgi:hypothetical protein